MFAEDNRLYRALDAAKARVRAFGAATAKVGAGLFAGGAAAGAAGLLKVVDSLGDTAQIDKAAKAFGLTAEAASGLFGVLSANGAENARENIESLVTLSGRVKDALDGTGEQAGELFEGLSVSARQLSGLPLDEQFYAMHDAISRLQDPTERVNRLMLAFGEDGGKTLIGTLSQSTAALREQARTFALSGDEMGAAASATAAYNTAVATLSTVWRKVATAAAPVVESVAGLLTEYLTPLSAWVSANRPVVETAAKVFFGLAAGAAAAGAALAVLGPAAAVVSTVVAGVVTTIGGVVGTVAGVGAAVLGAVGSVVAAVAAVPAAFAAVGAAVAILPELLAAAAVAAAGVAATFAAGVAVVGGLAAAFLYLTDAGAAVRGVLAKAFGGDFAGAADDAAGHLKDAWGSVLGWLDDHFGATFENAAETWGAVVDAVSAGDLEGAASLAFDGLRVEWARLTLFLTEQWTEFKGTFVDGWHDAMTSVRKALVDVMDYFKGEIASVLDALADLVAMAPQAFARVGVSADGIRAARDRAITNDPEAEKARIDREAEDAQAARDASRHDDKQRAVGSLIDESIRADRNRSDAPIDRALRDVDAEFDRATKAAEARRRRPPPGADDPAKLGKSVTSFGGFGDTKQIFGGVGGGLAKVVDATKAGTKAVEGRLNDINRTLEELAKNGLGFA